jgi:hypothetical protein
MQGFKGRVLLSELSRTWEIPAPDFWEHTLDPRERDGLTSKNSAQYLGSRLLLVRILSVFLSAKSSVLSSRVIGQYLKFYSHIHLFGELMHTLSPPDAFEFGLFFLYSVCHITSAHSFLVLAPLSAKPKGSRSSLRSRTICQAKKHSPLLQHRPCQKTKVRGRTID